ncbi:hypothetical protein RND81_06G156200 [Saponaria officinalis]|uniref:Uncharacterized protein n=1 Tax=Saponaria officinalis TaxID=3572 RepID=A0AAW1KC20_SAPOF
MAKILLLSVLYTTIALLSLSTATTTAEKLTAHNELSTFGFPAGLLPSAVAGYALNRTSGDFAVNFRKPCKITLPPDNYLAEFSTIVRGKIVQNKIGELDGIRVWAFFKWWSITGIKLSGSDLVFEVGMVTAKYPAFNFDVSPACEGFSKNDS